MKNAFILFSCICLEGCVSLKDYKELESQINFENEALKKTKKEISQLEKQNRVLEDSITMNYQLAGLLSNKIEKRLAAKKIAVKLDSKDLKALDIENQNFEDEFYKEFVKNHNFSDTNSARLTKWMSKDEKELVYWLNYARLNPSKFCMKYIYPLYLNNNNSVYLATLMDYMLSMKPVPALVPEMSLFESAKCHAESMGKAGLYGHKRLEGCTSKFSGECCSYGLSKPLDIVIQLLVDQGVTSIGHRYICLGSYSKIGISIKPHKTFGTNAVLDFGYGSI